MVDSEGECRRRGDAGGACVDVDGVTLRSAQADAAGGERDDEGRGGRWGERVHGRRSAPGRLLSALLPAPVTALIFSWLPWPIVQAVVALPAAVAAEYMA